MEVMSWRTYLYKDSTQVEELVEEAGPEHRSSCFAEVLEGEETSSVEVAVASHMVRRVYQAGGNQEYTSVGEGVVVAESRVK